MNSSKKLILKIIIFLLTFSLLIGSSYALVKHFKLDNKIKDLFNLDDKVVDEIDGNNLNIKKEYDDLTINILQTITVGNNLYIRFDLIGKSNKKYISENNLSKDLETDDDLYDGIGLNLLDEKDNTTSYLMDVSFKKDFEAGTYSINISTSDNKNYVMSLNIDKNDSKTIKKNINEIIYNKNNLILTLNYISINNNNITVNYNVNNDENFNKLEEYGEQFYNCKLEYKNNKFENLVLIVNKNLNADNTYNSIFGYSKNFVDLDNIKSIIINDVKISLSK